MYGRFEDKDDDEHLPELFLIARKISPASNLVHLLQSKALMGINSFRSVCIMLLTVASRPVLSLQSRRLPVGVCRTLQRAFTRQSSINRKSHVEQLLPTLGRWGGGLSALGLASIYSSTSTENSTLCTPSTCARTFSEDSLQYDHYNGITIRADKLDETELASFEERLADSLVTWKEEGRKGIWLNLSREQAHLVGPAVEAGFDFHTTQSGSLVLAQWLPDTPSRLPEGPSHQVGVGCFVLHPDDRSKMLVVQEQTGPAAAMGLWKMPTGLSDASEDIHDAAIRELQEETGIDATFKGIMIFRQAHPVISQRITRSHSDLFFVCLMTPSGTWKSALQACPTEIKAVQWMSVEEYCSQEAWAKSPVYQSLNRVLLEATQTDKPALLQHHTLELGYTNGANSLYFPASSNL